MKRAIYPFLTGSISMLYEDGKLYQLMTHAERVNEITGKTVFTEEVYQQLQEYIDGKRREFTIPYVLQGTPFQKQVWHALLQIPYGTTCTYEDIACQIGNPKAMRAVGQANNRNPLHIIIPCHRVIGKNRKLTGYAGGLKIKEALLALEKK